MIAIAALVLAQTAPAAEMPTRPVLDARLVAKILTHANPAAPPNDTTNRFANDPAAAEFGRELFFEKRLSGNGAIACATCHDPARGFADGQQLSQGLQRGARHTPSLWNAAYERWFFWDGHADSLWSQALKPIESPLEMGGDRSVIARLVRDDAQLRTRYERVFGGLEEPERAETVDRVFANVGKSLAAFQTTLVSADSPFDRFARSIVAKDELEMGRYPDDALRGLALFMGRANCRLCHAGTNFTDGEFHDIGMPTLDRTPPRDTGRRGGIERVVRDPFNASGAFSDDPAGERAREIAQLAPTSDTWGQFKTPSLRNVARTAPYMHQGQMADLDAVLRYYSTLEGALAIGHHGETVLQPLALTPREMDDLEAFLGSLTDESVLEGVVRPPLDGPTAR